MSDENLAAEIADLKRRLAELEAKQSAKEEPPEYAEDRLDRRNEDAP